jgi:hypothetical protein
MVLSCGCLHREKASQQTSDTPQAQRMRDWRERRNSPDYQPKAQWRTDDEGRECSYSGRGSCGHAYKPWSAYSSGETRCKACMVVKAAEYLEHEPDEARLRRAERQRAYLKTEPGRAANRRARLKYRYGITEEQYLWLLEQQDGACFLCGNGETVPHHASGDLMRLGVEHAHDCDQGHDPEKGCPACVRSLACYNCNVFMGRVERSPRLAARFADYLVRRPLLSWKQ